MLMARRSRTLAWVVTAVAFLGIVVPGAAGATTGYLSYLGSNTVPSSVAVSLGVTHIQVAPGGAEAYAIAPGYMNPQDAIIHYHRLPDGQLSFADCVGSWAGGGCATWESDGDRRESRGQRDLRRLGRPQHQRRTGARRRPLPARARRHHQLRRLHRREREAVPAAPGGQRCPEQRGDVGDRLDGSQPVHDRRRSLTGDAPDGRCRRVAPLRRLHRRRGGRMHAAAAGYLSARVPAFGGREPR